MNRPITTLFMTLPEYIYATYNELMKNGCRIIRICNE